jgi:hypothetical protein
MDSIDIEYYGPFMVPAGGSAGWLQTIGMLEAVTRHYRGMGIQS